MHRTLNGKNRNESHFTQIMYHSWRYIYYFALYSIGPKRGFTHTVINKAICENRKKKAL